jgi:hypothetical protein
MIALAFAGCGESGSKPSAEQRNRQAVETVIGSVNDAEWQRARAASTEPERHVKVSQIIEFRAEATQLQIDKDAKATAEKVDASSAKFQRDLDKTMEESRRQAAAQLEAGRRAREKAAADLKKANEDRIEQARLEQISLIRQRMAELKRQIDSAAPDESGAVAERALPEIDRLGRQLDEISRQLDAADARAKSGK